MKHYNITGGAWYGFHFYCCISVFNYDKQHLYDSATGFRLIKRLKQ